MAKFLILDHVQAIGQNPQTGQQVAAMFVKGSDIEGTIINENGFTLISDGNYWQFPVEKLFPIDQPEITMSVDPDRGQGYPKPNFSEGNNGNGSATDKPKEPIWKHPEMPNWIGAAIGGLIGMRASDKIGILPGPLNWLLFTGLGALGGYTGTKYLMGKFKELKTAVNESDNNGK